MTNKLSIAKLFERCSVVLHNCTSSDRATVHSYGIHFFVESILKLSFNSGDYNRHHVWAVSIDDINVGIVRSVDCFSFP